MIFVQQLVRYSGKYCQNLIKCVKHKLTTSNYSTKSSTHSWPILSAVRLSDWNKLSPTNKTIHKFKLKSEPGPQNPRLYPISPAKRHRFRDFHKSPRIVSWKFNICTHCSPEFSTFPPSPLNFPIWRLHLTLAPPTSQPGFHREILVVVAAAAASAAIMRVIQSQFNYFIIKVMIWCIILN